MRNTVLALFLSVCVGLLPACESDSKTTTTDGAAAAGQDAASDTGATSNDGSAGQTGTDAAADAPSQIEGGGSVDGSLVDGRGASDAPVLSPAALRGQYLVGLLGCAGCHTPTVAGGTAPDTAKAFSGRACFVTDTATSGCLNSANLTNDDTGLKKFTDQQVKDMFTKGLDDSGKYLWAQMPYYQFANLTDLDADAIVAFLRSLPAIQHELPANGVPFDKRPSAPEWASAPLANLPAPSNATDPSASNGKYVAALVCLNCHTVDSTDTGPKHRDVTKAYQGGRIATTTLMGVSKQIQSANLTPDMTGLHDWNAAQVATAIKTAKDDKGRMLCSPMRAFSTMTDKDAMDIASYLQAIPPVANAVTMKCE